MEQAGPYVRLKFRPTKQHFELLKTKNHEKFLKFLADMAVEFGCTVEELNMRSCSCCTGCYCACPKGPCEHVWNGPDWTSEDGCATSITCSNCGTTAMSHDLRTAEW